MLIATVHIVYTRSTIAVSIKMISRLRFCSSQTRSTSLLIRRRNASENFIVRRLTSPEEVRQGICERAATNGHRPGALDHISYFAADETGFFVGELEGKPISCLSVVKHADNFAHLGHYMVDEPYRGSGYGLLTWKAAMASIDESYNTGGFAIEEKVPIFQRVGLQPKWCVQRFDLVASQVEFALSKINSPPSFMIQPASEVDFQNLLRYDTEVHVFQRQSFLEKWITAPNCHASVAISDNGRVVGYIVIRTTLKREEGWRVGPLFADNSQIARSLYREVCSKIAAENPEDIIAVDVPYGDLVNPDALKIVKELSGIPTFKCVRLYTKGIPSSMPLKKLFGITSLEIG